MLWYTKSSRTMQYRSHTTPTYLPPLYPLSSLHSIPTDLIPFPFSAIPIFHSKLNIQIENYNLHKCMVIVSLAYFIQYIHINMGVRTPTHMDLCIAATLFKLSKTYALYIRSIIYFDYFLNFLEESFMIGAS